MKKIIYIISYDYCQYNSEQADGGDYSKKVEFEDMNEAKSVDQMFKDYLDNKLSSDNKQELENKYIPGRGYFKKVQLFKSVKEEYPFDFHSHKKHHEYNDFFSCPECFSKEEGDSLGCDYCDGKYYRKLTLDSIYLSLSAKEWADEQMSNLWSIYNKIFKLNYGLSKWYISGNKIYMESGYSCRGSVYEKTFELKIEWLLNPNREVLIQQFKDQLDGKENEKRKLEDLAELSSLKKSIQQLENKIKLN